MQRTSVTVGLLALLVVAGAGVLLSVDRVIQVQSMRAQVAGGDGIFECTGCVGSGPYTCQACNGGGVPPAKRCGNGIVEAGEECDGGAANGTGGNGCNKYCQLTLCGNGLWESPPEGCDDGNQNNEDGCTNLCVRTSVCGNGAMEYGEECDDGNKIDTDYCSNSCFNLAEDHGVCSGYKNNCLRSGGLSFDCNSYWNAGCADLIGDTSVPCTDGFNLAGGICISDQTPAGTCTENKIEECRLLSTPELPFKCVATPEGGTCVGQGTPPPTESCGEAMKAYCDRQYLYCRVIFGVEVCIDPDVPDPQSTPQTFYPPSNAMPTTTTTEPAAQPGTTTTEPTPTTAPAAEEGCSTFMEFYCGFQFKSCRMVNGAPECF